tara:strand:- start:10235 stop:10654 length:420 start_codon:yes stop_codon:yes gene_type:complete
VDLSIEQRIELDHLLLQREAAYARVHRAEAEIQKIFGGDYPLPPPPEEVASGGKNSGGRKAAAKKVARKVAPKLRPLDYDEIAYRVAFLQRGRTVQEDHVDRKALQSLLKSGAAGRVLVSIDILRSGGDVVERVYEPEG